MDNDWVEHGWDAAERSLVGSGCDGAGTFLGANTSSFTEFLTSYSPGLLPGNRPLPAGLTGGLAGGLPGGLPAAAVANIPHGTTIVAAACDVAVVMVGDRRAPAGNPLAPRAIEKEFRPDDHPCVGTPGG